MRLDAAKAFVIKKLEKELSPNLTYHNVNHTLYVFDKANEIAAQEGITGEDLDILLTAALMHDTGFIKKQAGHERISCDYAKEILPGFDYSQKQIEEVCVLIMATQMPQHPLNKLSEILCDADLYYLGTNNYSDTSETLFAELNKTGHHIERQAWMHEQERFLKSHHYFTKSVADKIEEKKYQNLEALKEIEHEAKSVQHRDFSFSDIILIIVGVIIAGFALKGFLVPNNFFDGGVTGISLLIHEKYEINLGIVIMLANLPLVIISAYVANVKFALKTLLCVVMLGICLLYFPYPEKITSDKLLVAIFGGFFLGTGIGLTMRAGCALDGIEVLALYTWRRSSFTISEIVLALNIIIFSLAAFEFGLEVSLYSMLTYFTASKTVDYVVEGVEAYTGVTIISGKSEVIKHRLVNELGRGITIYKGERGYLPGKFEIYSDADIIFTVITRLEMRKLKNLVNEVDPKAFVFASTIKEASGGVIKRRHVH